MGPRDIGTYQIVEGYGFLTPLRLILVRLQGVDAGLVGSDGRFLTGARVGQTPLYVSLARGLRTIYVAEGVQGLWRGGTALTVRGSLHSMGHLCGYN